MATRDDDSWIWGVAFLGFLMFLLFLFLPDEIAMAVLFLTIATGGALTAGAMRARAALHRRTADRHWDTWSPPEGMTYAPDRPGVLRATFRGNVRPEDATKAEHVTTGMVQGHDPDRPARQWVALPDRGRQALTPAGLIPGRDTARESLPGQCGDSDAQRLRGRGASRWCGWRAG